jgi:hypothetical protein
MEAVSQPLTSTVPSLSTVVVPPSGSNSLQSQIAAILEISASIVARPAIVDLQLAYAKYLAYFKARATISTMSAAGTWTLKNPSADELVEVFVSKSVWHRNYKLFARAKEFPLLIQWLEGGENGPTDMEIFGYAHATYTFPDLRNYFANADTVGKGKRKADDDEDGGSPKKKGKKDGKKKEKKSSKGPE